MLILLASLCGFPPPLIMRYLVDEVIIGRQTGLLAVAILMLAGFLVAEKLARMLQEEDLGRTIRFIAELPQHVCINELVISPVFNRLYVGGKEF